MEREIKFRLYSDTLKVMFTPDTQISNLWAIKKTENGILRAGEGEILMQYTGLKDANGVEIYEGDIVRLLSSYTFGEFNVPVVFNDGMFEALGSGLLVHAIAMNNAVVVGNIYENPEEYNH